MGKKVFIVCLNIAHEQIQEASNGRKKNYNNYRDAARVGK